MQKLVQDGWTDEGLVNDCVFRFLSGSSGFSPGAGTLGPDDVSFSPPMFAIRSTRTVKQLCSSSRAMTTMTPATSARNTFATDAQLDSLVAAGWRIVESKSANSVQNPPSAEAEGYAAQPPSERRLQREFEFRDFSQAWAFMSRCALAAEKLNVRWSMI